MAPSTRAARRKVLLTLTVLLSLAGACSSGTAPILEPVNFTTTLVGFRWIDPPIGPTVNMSARRIEVTGLISTSDPCQDLRGRAIRARRAVLLTVTARTRSGGCVEAIGTFEFTAVIADVSPGTYMLKVDYVYENSGWPSKQALLREVTVP